MLKEKHVFSSNLGCHSSHRDSLGKITTRSFDRKGMGLIEAMSTEVETKIYKGC